MDRREVNVLLALMAARDGRTIGQVEVEAWFEDVGRWDLATAREAVHRHYSKSREFMRPFDLIQQIRAIRHERLDAVGAITPPVHLADDPVTEMAWLRAAREAIATGRAIPDAPPAEIERRDPDLSKRIEDLAASKRVTREALDQARTARDEPTLSVRSDQTAEAMEAERNRQLDALEAMGTTAP